MYVLLLVPDQQYKMSNTTQLLAIHQLSYIYQSSHIVAIFHVCIFKESMLSLVLCCSFLYFFFWMIIDIIPLLVFIKFLITNHQQNATTDTDLVDNLKLLIWQPVHNGWTSFLNCTYWQWMDPKITSVPYHNTVKSSNMLFFDIFLLALIFVLFQNRVKIVVLIFSLVYHDQTNQVPWLIDIIDSYSSVLLAIWTD